MTEESVARSIPSGRGRGTGRSARSRCTRTRSARPERLPAVRAEDVTDRLLRRALERRRGGACCSASRLAPRELRRGRGRSWRGSPRASDVRSRRRSAASFSKRGSERSQRCFSKKPDHGGRPLHRRDVSGELGAEIGGRAGLGRGGCENENEGAQARDQGFQGTTSASGTGSRRAPQSGPTRRARRCRLCQIRRGYRRRTKSLPDRLRNVHKDCYKRFRVEQRETPLAGRFGGCGTGTRTPTSGLTRTGADRSRPLPDAALMLGSACGGSPCVPVRTCDKLATQESRLLAPRRSKPNAGGRSDAGAAYNAAAISAAEHGGPTNRQPPRPRRPRQQSRLLSEATGGRPQQRRRCRRASGSSSASAREACRTHPTRRRNGAPSGFPSRAP